MATTTADVASSTPPSAMVPAPVTITYTDKGFDPKTVTITQGQTVTWVNNSTHQMWIASAQHPTHMGYDGTSREAHCAASYTGAAPFDECKAEAASASYSFTFDKAGTWPYHDHVNSTMFGTITVTAAPATPGVNVNASTTVNVH
jgi:plastocyanin